MASPKAERDHGEEAAEAADSDDAPANPSRGVMRHEGGYRVAGDLQFRSAELEQDLVHTRERLKEIEREVWAARKAVRRSKALATTALAAGKGGAGATLAALFGLLLYALELASSPPFLLGMVVVGFAIGALAGMKWSSDDDDDFPPAPPPRLGF